MTPLAFTDDQLAEVLSRARLIADDTERDQYFERVADALRDRLINDDSVRHAAAVAFKKYARPRDK